jgi:hypothetical protein
VGTVAIKQTCGVVAVTVAGTAPDYHRIPFSPDPLRSGNDQTPEMQKTKNCHKTKQKVFMKSIRKLSRLP